MVVGCCPWWIIIQWLYSDYPHLVACYILLLPCYYPSEELCVKYGEILHAMALSFAFSISERTSQSSSEKDAGGWWGMLPLCWNLGPSELLGHFVSFPKKTQKKTMTHCHIWLLKATWNSLRWLYHGLSEDRVPMGTPISYHLKWNVESESHDIFRHFPPIFVELLFEGGSCSKRST